MELHPGEEIVFEGHPSWRAVLAFYLAGIALVAVAVVIGLLASGVGIAIVAGAIVLGLVILAGLIKRMATRYLITTERLQIRRGILAKTTQETRVQRVQNVNTEQSVLQRILRVGTVDFDTAGTDDSEFRFIGVANPATSSAPSTARSAPRPARAAARRPVLASDQPVADLVVDALALGRERLHRLARPLRLGDLPVQPVALELQALDLQRGRVGGEVARLDHQPGDQVRQGVVVGRQPLARVLEVLGQVVRGAAGQLDREGRGRCPSRPARAARRP